MLEPTKNNATDKNKKLSILIGRDGLSFCVSGPSKTKISSFEKRDFKTILAPSNILKQIELTFEQCDLDFDAMGKTHVLFSNNFYSFVPHAFFDEKHLSDYLKFGTKILSTDFIAHDRLSSAKLENVYIPYANIINYFFDKFGVFEYEHVTSALVENLLILEKENPKKTVYVHVHPRHVDMVVIGNAKLILCNTFAYAAPEDFLYYILFVAEQLKLDPEIFPLVFIGAVSEDSEIYKICYKYIRNCSFLQEEISLKKEFGFTAYPESSINYVLLKSHVCE